MDKKYVLAVFAIGFLVGSIVTLSYYRAFSAPPQVFFSPNGGCEQVVLYYISHAKSSIHILMFSFTVESIADALIASHRRGVDVKVVLEAEQIYSYEVYWKLKNAGVEVRNDTNLGFMHNKVAIIDGQIILTGSYNWTNTAEQLNNENLIVIRDKGLASRYEAEFQKIWGQSV